MNNKITYHKEGDYYIPDLYLEDYKKRLSNWKVWIFKIRIFEKSQKS